MTETATSNFFTMELLEGELLSSLMARFHPLPMSRAHAWSIIGQIASGLEHAHQQQIVHADLKPQNIMITNAGEVRILDFGASRSLANQAHGAARFALSIIRHFRLRLLRTLGWPCAGPAR